MHSRYPHWRTDSRESPRLPASAPLSLLTIEMPLRKVGTFLGGFSNPHKKLRASPHSSALLARWRCPLLCMVAGGHTCKMRYRDHKHFSARGKGAHICDVSSGDDHSHHQTMAVLGGSTWPFLLKPRVVGPVREPRSLPAAHGYSSQLEGGASQMHNPPL